ncbi:major facilitator superfamily protein [Escherichia coli]|nr:major facilitator superfamily protein [Escherichia coli]
MNLSLRRSTSALLASSLLLTIGRGATLPFMTIYLSRQYSLSVDLIGYAMTIALTIGVVLASVLVSWRISSTRNAICYWQLRPSPAVLLLFPWLTASRWCTFFRTHQLRLFRFCHSVESLVCRQSFIHQQNEDLLDQLHHAQYWLDRRPATRHAVGHAEHQSALLAGRYLLCVSHVFHSNLGKAQRENHRHGNRQCLVAESFITR